MCAAIWAAEREHHVIIEYTPEGGERERFDAARLRASEIQIVERTADRRWVEIREGLGEGDVTAMRTVAWVIKKRAEPSLRYAEFDPFERELLIRLDASEVRAFAKELVKRYGEDPEELAEAFAELRDAAADSEACEAVIADVTSPKEQAPAQSVGESAESLTSPSGG